MRFDIPLAIGGTNGRSLWPVAMTTLRGRHDPRFVSTKNREPGRPTLITVVCGSTGASNDRAYRSKNRISSGMDM